MSESGDRIVRTVVPYNYFNLDERVSKRSLLTLIGAFDFSSVGMVPPNKYGFLSNGGRLTVENDNYRQPILSYAGPECRGVDEAADQELAGDAFVLHLLRTTTNDSLRRPHSGLFKRTATIHDKGPAYLQRGSIFSVSPELFENEENVPRLASWFVLHKLLGAGMVGGRDYYFAQKCLNINTRDPCKPKDVGRRPLFHFNTSPTDPSIEVYDDSSIKRWGITMQLATTSLVLDLIEQEKFPDELVMAEPYRTLLELRCLRNLGSAVIELDSGQRIDAATAHTILATAAQRLDTSERGQELVQEWDLFGENLGKVDLERQDLGDLVSRGPDWAPKLKCIWNMTGCQIVRSGQKAQPGRPSPVDVDLNWDRRGCGPGHNHCFPYDQKAGTPIMSEIPETRARVRQCILESQVPGLTPVAFDRVQLPGRQNFINLPDAGKAAPPEYLRDLLDRATEARLIKEVEGYLDP